MKSFQVQEDHNDQLVQRNFYFTIPFFNEQYIINRVPHCHNKIMVHKYSITKMNTYDSLLEFYEALMENYEWRFFP
jgi:hypothetical protein